MKHNVIKILEVYLQMKNAHVEIHLMFAHLRERSLLIVDDETGGG